MNETKQEEQVSPWLSAQTKCWAHIETCTMMMRYLSTLSSVRIASVIPIISDASPSLMITPEDPKSELEVRALCRLIKETMQSSKEWEQHSFSAEWTLRLVDGNLTIDVITSIPATKETPISL